MPKRIPVASIHTSFNINRNPHEAHEGDVTLDEQIKAMTRFVRWHKRQVEVGELLLRQLSAQVVATEPTTEAGVVNTTDDASAPF